MATVENAQIESTLTSEAVALLDCFSCEFDELLSHIAQSLALAHTKPGEAVVIRKDDVARAAKVIFDSVQNSDLPPSVKSEVAAMMDCVASKSDCS